MKKVPLFLIATAIALVFLSGCPCSAEWQDKSLPFGPFYTDVVMSPQSTGTSETGYAVDLTGMPPIVSIKDFSVTIEATLVNLATVNGFEATATAIFYFENVAAVDSPVMEFDVKETVEITKGSDPTLVNAVKAVLNDIINTGEVDFKVEYTYTGINPAVLELEVSGVIKTGL